MEKITFNSPLTKLLNQINLVEKEDFSFCLVDNQLTVRKNSKDLLSNLELLKKIEEIVKTTLEEKKSISLFPSDKKKILRFIKQKKIDVDCGKSIQNIELFFREEQGDVVENKKEAVPSATVKNLVLDCFVYDVEVQKWFFDAKAKLKEYRGAVGSGNRTAFGHNVAQILDSIAFCFGHRFFYKNGSPSLALFCFIDCKEFHYKNKQEMLTYGFRKPFLSSDLFTLGKMTCIHRSFMTTLSSGLQNYQRQILNSFNSKKYLYQETPSELQQFIGIQANDGSYIASSQGRMLSIVDPTWGCTISVLI